MLGPVRFCFDQMSKNRIENIFISFNLIIENQIAKNNKESG